MTAKEEAAYIRGKKHVWAEIGELADSKRGRGKRASDSEQLRTTRTALRDLFEELQIAWPGDELHLADVVEKHLARALLEL